MKRHFISGIAIILFFTYYGCSKNDKKASCSDGIVNQGETKTDCGGPCKACASCSDGIQNQNETKTDCGGACAACPTCSDGVQNQGESGIDCGGPCAAACNPTANPASQNTSLLVGGSGWDNPACGTTNSLVLKGVNGTVSVTLSFASAAASGTYVIGTAPATGVCALTVLNAPNQLSGTTWIGRSGAVVVNTAPASILASFNGIVCTQQNFNFPTVIVSGTLACSQ